MIGVEGEVEGGRARSVKAACVFCMWNGVRRGLTKIQASVCGVI